MLTPFPAPLTDAPPCAGALAAAPAAALAPRREASKKDTGRDCGAGEVAAAASLPAFPGPPVLTPTPEPEPEPASDGEPALNAATPPLPDPYSPDNNAADPSPLNIPYDNPSSPGSSCPPSASQPAPNDGTGGSGAPGANTNAGDSELVNSGSMGGSVAPDAGGWESKSTAAGRSIMRLRPISTALAVADQPRLLIPSNNGRTSWGCCISQLISWSAHWFQSLTSRMPQYARFVVMRGPCRGTVLESSVMSVPARERPGRALQHPGRSNNCAGNGTGFGATAVARTGVDVTKGRQLHVLQHCGTGTEKTPGKA